MTLDPRKDMGAEPIGIGKFLMQFAEQLCCAASAESARSLSMNEAEYRRAEARLEEALAIFAEKEAQFSALIARVGQNVSKVRRDVAALRTQRAYLTESTKAAPVEGRR
jgi:hypothetical protein